MTEIQEGQTATNPKTGQRVVYRGGQWHAVAAIAGAAPAPQLTGNARNLALQKVASLMALRRQTAETAGIYNRDFSRESGRSSVMEMVPGIMNGTNARYDAALAGLKPLARAAFRVPGSGADSDRESQAFMDLVPSRTWTNDSGAKQSYQQMFRIIDDSVEAQQRLLGQSPARAAGFKVIR